MNSTKRLLLGVLLAVTVATAFAHVGGHDDDTKPISAQQAVKLSDYAVSTLVKDKKIDASWIKAQAQGAKQQNSGAELVWVVSYVNTAEKSAAKKTLYVFLDALGNFLDANHTGNR